MQMCSNYGRVLHMNMPFLITELVAVIRYFHMLNIYHCFDKLNMLQGIIDPFFYNFFNLHIVMFA